MTFGYETSVILIALAIFGIYCFVKDLWLWSMEPRVETAPRMSLLILVKDIEQDLEDMVRQLMLKIQATGIECDVILCDYHSEDLTYEIAKRLERDYAALTTVRSRHINLIMSEVLPYARGSTIQILDVVKRIKPEEFFGIITSIFKPYSKKFIF